MNDDQIIFNVTAVEEEVNVEESVFDLKSAIGHTEAEAMLPKCINWFEVQKVLLFRKVRNNATQRARVSKKHLRHT